MDDETALFADAWQSGLRLAAGLSYEALLDAGWSPEELARILKNIEGFEVQPVAPGKVALTIEWSDEPLDADTMTRIQDEAPLFLVALNGMVGEEPQVV